LCPADPNTPYGCGDCVDNDGDGLADDKDPECLGPCDDTEGPVLLTGTSGEANNSCGADCYFEGGAGSGSGDCTWNRQCDPLEPKDGCDYCGPDSGNACKQGSFDNICPEVQPFPDTCEQGCGALTPNGCDCFGCCTFPQLTNGGYVYLGSEIGSEGTCTLAELNNPELCRPCTPAVNCLNECGRCELCLGKTTIPEDCFPGAGGAGGMAGMGGSGGMGGTPDLRCDPGVQPCGLPGDDPCEAGGFCLTGCCIIVQ
jgi:hypothetical protein